MSVAGPLLFGVPPCTFALPRSKPARVALVLIGVPASDMTGPEPANRYAREFVHRLRELGYVEGRDIVVERRGPDAQLAQLPAVMKDLVDHGVDVIVVSGPGVQAAARATSTIPIVAQLDDPLGGGLTDSLARPTRNVTGVTITAGVAIHGKRLQLLREVAPDAKRVGVIDFKYVDRRTTPGTHLRRMEIEATARTLGLSFIPVGVNDADEFDAALALAARQGVDSLVEVGNPVTWAGRRTIVEFASRNRLPAVYASRDFTDLGGLLSYGPYGPGTFGRMAEFVDKLLKGATPADLPFENPTTYELIVNIGTARALGLAVPRSVLLRASEVIS